MVDGDATPGASAAVLTIGECFWRAKAAFYAFARSAFTRIRDAGVRTLVIDIRANIGGDDDMWMRPRLYYHVATW